MRNLRAGPAYRPLYQLTRWKLSSPEVWVASGIFIFFLLDQNCFSVGGNLHLGNGWECWLVTYLGPDFAEGFSLINFTFVSYPNGEKEMLKGISKMMGKRMGKWTGLILWETPFPLDLFVPPNLQGFFQDLCLLDFRRCITGPWLAV